tara:strand:- start:367 stop:579 length:213 start_codon:yes stop_codon:yes gene_type:complete
MADEEKAKTKRRSNLPIYAVMQIMDENGSPMPIPKDDVNIIGGYKNAENVLDIMESGEYPNAIYKKISYS